MKKLLLITIFYCPLFLSAQKLLKPSIDKISGDTTWSTSKEKFYANINILLNKGEGIYCWVLKTSKSKIILVLNPQRVNEQVVFSIAKDQKAYLKLNDNSTITLNAAIDNVGDAKVDQYLSNTVASGNAYGYYILSDSDVEKLKSSTITFVRVETTTGNFDGDIKPKNSELIKKEINIIEKH